MRNLTGAGLSVVVAAGNDRTKEVSQMIPAGYPEVIAAASSTAVSDTVILQDTASYFTTDGAFDHATGIGITVSAPGEERETVNQKRGTISSVGILSTKLGGGTTRMSGTSMAAPHVAGVVALLCQAYPGLLPEEARARIMSGAQGVGALPVDSPTVGNTPDGDYEGILYAPGALAAP